MKLHIDIEVDASEIPIVQELITVLRGLTESLTVKQSSTPATQANHRKTLDAGSAVTKQTVNHQPQATARVIPLVTKPEPVQAPVQAPVQHAVVPQPPSMQLQDLRPLVTQLQANPSEQETVATRVNGFLQANPQSFDQFLELFQSIVFDPKNAYEQLSIVPYMELLPKMTEPFRSKMRDALVPRVLKHLTIKRPVDVDRAAFFSQAEAFAALANIQYVSIPGAVQTILTLLKKPDSRSAAITMLGKTIELCYEQLMEKSDPGKLEEIVRLLNTVHDPVFQYDLSYIQSYLVVSPQHNGGVPIQTEAPSAAAA